MSPRAKKAVEPAPVDIHRRNWDDAVAKRAIDTADYESPHAREVAQCQAEIAYYLKRGSDPSRLTKDRADAHRRANVARARLRELTRPATPTTTEHED